LKTTDLNLWNEEKRVKYEAISLMAFKYLLFAIYNVKLDDEKINKTNGIKMQEKREIFLNVTK
jgi:hypothetical protein